MAITYLMLVNFKFFIRLKKSRRKRSEQLSLLRSRRGKRAHDRLLCCYKKIDISNMRRSDNVKQDTNYSFVETI